MLLTCHAAARTLRFAFAYSFHVVMRLNSRDGATVDPRLLPSENPFKYHVVVTLSLQPISQYIITTMLDDVLHCFCFVFDVFLVSLHGD